MYRSTIPKPGNYPFAKAFLAAFLATSVLRPEVPCYAEAPRAEVRFRSTQPRGTYRHLEKNKHQDRTDAEDSETTVEFILSFSDPVQLSVLETLGGEEPTMLVLEPLTWDYTRWAIQLERSIVLDGWIELLVVDGQMYVIAAARIGMLQDGSNPAERRLQEVIFIEGEGDLVDVLPAYADHSVTVSAFIGVDKLADFPEPLRNPMINALLDGIDRNESFDDSVQLVVLQPYTFLEADTETVAVDTTPQPRAASCCVADEVCVVYGGEGCPGGTSPTTCPCWEGE